MVRRAAQCSKGAMTAAMLIAQLIGSARDSFGEPHSLSRHWSFWPSSFRGSLHLAAWHQGRSTLCGLVSVDLGPVVSVALGGLCMEAWSKQLAHAQAEAQGGVCQMR